MNVGGGQPRVFISYAREGQPHVPDVLSLADALSEHVGVTPVIDELVPWIQRGERDDDWVLWMTSEMDKADYILMIASPQYKRRGESQESADQYGVYTEGRHIRTLLNDPNTRHKIIPVALLGRSRHDLPNWLQAGIRDVIEIPELTPDGLEQLGRTIHRQRYYTPLPVGERPTYSTWRDERDRDGSARSQPGVAGQPIAVGAVPHEEAVTADEPTGPLVPLVPRGPIEIAAEFDRALATFKGRHQALEAIAEWLADPDDGTSRFVTGVAGSGKTALLGIVAHLANGDDDLVRGGLPASCVPRRGSLNLAVYAKNKAPGDMLEQLATTAGMPAEQVAELGTLKPAEAARKISSFLRQRGSRMTVLIDALDEVSPPKKDEDVAEHADLEALGDALRPLIEAPGHPVRLLFGGRRQVLEHLGFGMPEGPGRDERVIGLDTRHYSDDQALRNRVRSVLQAAGSIWAAAGDDLVETAVKGIYEKSNPSFFLAEKIAEAQAALTVLPDPASEAWQASLPRQAGSAIRDELHARFRDDGAGRDLAWVVGLLRPLAYARGSGMPWADVWLPVANALRPAGVRPYRPGDFTWIRAHASSYIVGIAEDDSRLNRFRLSHRLLDDYLQQDERYASGEHDRAGDEATIARTLRPAPSGDHGGHRDWGGASAYVRDHLLEHAAASGNAGLIDELVFDPDFLAHGRDVELRSALDKLGEPRHRAVAAVYSSARAAMRAHSPQSGQAPAGQDGADARAMLAQLSLAARCRGVGRLADAVSAGPGSWQAPWQATWAAWRNRPPHVRLSGHTGPVRTVVTTSLGGTPAVAITGGDDGMIRTWDVLDGVPIGQPIPTAHGGILAVAAGTLPDGTRIVVSAGADAVAHVWDPRTGSHIGQFPHVHSPVHAVAVLDAQDRKSEARVVTGDEDGTVYSWEPLSGGKRGDPRLYALRSPVTALALVRAGDSTLVVCGHRNGRIRVWTLGRKGTAREYTWHSRAVRAIAMTERGGQPLVVSADDDGAICVWDPMTGLGRDREPDAMVARHRGGVWALSVAETEGRKVIVSAGHDRTIRVWDFQDGSPVGSPFDGHEKTVRALAVTRAGNRVIVVSGGDDLAVQAWDLTAVVAAAEPFTADDRKPVHALAFGTIDGHDRLLSGSRGGAVRCWDADTGALIRQPVQMHRQATTALGFASVAGRECVVSGGMDTKVGIWDVTSGEAAAEPPAPDANPGRVWALLAVRPPGGDALLVSAYEEGFVRVWNPDGCAVVADYLGHSGAVRALCAVTVDPSGEDPLVVSAGDDGHLHAWRPETGERRLMVPSGHDKVTALAALPGRPSWLVSGGADGRVLLRNLADADRVPVEWPDEHRRSAVNSLAAVAHGDLIAIVSGHADGTVRFRDIASLTAEQGPVRLHVAQEYGGEVRALAGGTVGGQPVVFSGGDDGLIRVWDVGHKVRAQPPHRNWVRAIAVAELTMDSESTAPEWTVVSGGDDGTIQIRDLGGSRPGRELSAGHQGIRALSVATGDPSVIVAGGLDKRLLAWRPPGETPQTRAGHRDWIRAVTSAELPDGQRVLVSASGDGEVRVWDLATMSPLTQRKLHQEGGLRTVAVGEIAADNGPTQPVLVSAGIGTVRVWRLGTGGIISDKPLGAFSRHHAETDVRALAVTKLGERSVALSGDKDGVVWAWDLATREPIGGDPGEARPLVSGLGEINAIAAQQRLYPAGCTWVAVGASESVVLQRWVPGHGWAERAVARFDCDVLGVALPDDREDDEPAGLVAVAASAGVVVLEVD